MNKVKTRLYEQASFTHNPALVPASRVNLMHHILAAMSINSSEPVLITGDTGIGKTQFVKQMGKLLGLNVEVVEVPHITEEHVINIPFVVIKADGSQTSTSAKIPHPDKMKDLEVIIAQSYLARVLENSQPIPNGQLLKNYSNPAVFKPQDRAIWEHFGGSKTEIPAIFQLVRNKFKTILFLDEFYRTVPQSVRSILRNVLDRYIGADRMPKGVFVLTASNLEDEPGTIEKPAEHAEIDPIPMPIATKDEFFNHLVGKFGDKLRPELVDAIYSGIDDSHLSYNDENTGIRTSPRRWEQLILYINAHLPINSEQEARDLYSNIENNFRTETGTSELHKVVKNIVQTLIKKSGSSHWNVKPNEDTEWVNTFKHQLATKIKLGDDRTYVPTLVGPPGAGKSKMITAICLDPKINLLPITINLNSQDYEKLLGIPLPRETNKSDGAPPKTNPVSEASDQKKREIAPEFTSPPLKLWIDKEREYLKNQFLKNPNIPQSQKEKWENQQYKYLLFIDEFTRPMGKNQKTFNAIRQLMLDKKFANGEKLGDDTIIAAAMNPSGTGAVKLTRHVKDSMDMIPVHPTWKTLKSWLQSPECARAEEVDNIDLQYRKIAFQVINQLMTTLGKKGKNPDKDQFYIKIADPNAGTTDETQNNEQATIYLSARKLTNTWAKIAALLNTYGMTYGNDQKKMKEYAVNAIVDKIGHVLTDVLDRQSKDKYPGWISFVQDWAKAQLPKWFNADNESATFDTLMDDVLNGTALRDHINWGLYMASYTANSFAKDLAKWLRQKVKEQKNAYDIWAKNHPNRAELVDKKTETAENLYSILELVNENIWDAVSHHEFNNSALEQTSNVIWQIIDEVNAFASDLPKDEKAMLDRRGVEIMQRMKWIGQENEVP